MKGFTSVEKKCVCVWLDVKGLLENKLLKLQESDTEKEQDIT